MRIFTHAHFDVPIVRVAGHQFAVYCHVNLASPIFTYKSTVVYWLQFDLIDWFFKAKFWSNNRKLLTRRSSHRQIRRNELSIFVTNPLTVKRLLRIRYPSTYSHYKAIPNILTNKNAEHFIDDANYSINCQIIVIWFKRITRRLKFSSATYFFVVDSRFQRQQYHCWWCCAIRANAKIQCSDVPKIIGFLPVPRLIYHRSGFVPAPTKIFHIINRHKITFFVLIDC